MNLAIVHSLDEKIWREFVDQHPQGNIFHTPEMFQVFARARHHRPTLWGAIGDDGELEALMCPVQVTVLDGPVRRLTTRAVVYGSVLCQPAPAGERALVALLRDYARRARSEVLFTELRNLSDLSPIQGVLQQQGFAYEDHLNFLIDLKYPVESILQNIGARTRKHIRQALHKGNVIVEEVRQASQLGPWHALVSQSYRAAQVPLGDRSLFEAAFDILQPAGMIKFWLARIDDAYVAASAELLFKDVIYGWYSGVDRAYVAETPGEVLMWHVLRWGCENGYRMYDFGGAGKPSEPYGVRDFKAKFGGRLVCFGRNIEVHAPGLLRVSELGYRVYRRLIARA
jgi:serine/alanine adding enzyme